MNLPKIIWLVLISLLLNGCITLPLKKVTDHYVPIDRPFYTILPPPGDDWLYMTNDKPGGYDLFFGKKFSSPTHTLVATVKETHSYAQFKDVNDFLVFVKQSCMMDIDPRRFTLLNGNFELNNKYKYAAYKYGTAEDRLAPNSDGKDYLILKLQGYVVVNPENESVIISVDYSERGKKDELDPDFDAKARQFLESFKLK